mgnify:CR=1 FL=1
MMKKLFYVLIGLCAFCSCESTGYRISGYIPGAPDGAKVYLAPYDAFQDPNWDSTVIKNERFVLKNTIPMVSPRVVAITIDLNSGEKDYSKIKSSRALFLKEGDRISMECHVDSLPSSRWEARDKSLNVVWQGSADQDLYVNYLKDRKDVVIERNKLGDQYFMDYYKKSDVPSERMPELMNMVHQVKALGRKLNAKTLDLMKANGSSLVSVYVGDALLKGNFSVFTESEIDAIHDLVDPLLLSSPMGEKFEEAVAQAKVLAKGKRYTDINLVDLKGNQVRLSEFMKEGQCNMLEFWASWCSPCRGEIPHLRHLYEVCGKDFNMISVSIDERDTDWKKAVQEEGMQWHQLCDQKGRKGPVVIEYQVFGIPDCIVLDPEGKIVCGGVRGAELDVVVQDLLGEKAKGL